MFNPKAKRIFRFVSILEGIPFSIRAMVMGDIFALRASSVLLIIKDSLTSLKELLFIVSYKSFISG